MATRKDLLKAHSFTTQRMVSALVDRDPDAPKSPLSRVTTATFVSVLIGVVALAGFTLLGKIRPGQASNWKSTNVVIQDMDSGSLFVWTENSGPEGGQLTPMADIVSARLKAGEQAKGNPNIVQVKSKLIKEAPRGPLMGIPGAPRQIPQAADIKPLPLQACVTAPQNNGTERFITVSAGNLTAPKQGYAIAAETEDGEQYIIVGGRTHQLPTPDSGRSALIEGLPFGKLPAAWVQSLPMGDPIRPFDLPARGTTAGGTQRAIGNLYVIGGPKDANARYFIQTSTGLAKISYLDMRLWQITNQQTGDPQPISEAQYAAGAAPSTAKYGTEGLPAGPPQGPPGVSDLEQTSVCATYDGDPSGNPTITVGQSTPTIPATNVHPKQKYADVVSMAPMTGALLANADLAGDRPPSSFLLFQQKLYPIPTDQARRSLGYDDKAAVAKVPSGLLKLFEPGLAPGLKLDIASIRNLEGATTPMSTEPPG